VQARVQSPAQLLPLLFIGTAHLALAAAGAAAGVWPRAVAGFFYHPWMLGIVHLVTLGWITFSIFGAIYIVGPLALRSDMAVRRADYAAYAVLAIGLPGMVGHFWIRQYSGMAWSASAVAAGVLYMTVRIARGVRRAPIQRAVKLHVGLACANIWIAGSLGVLVAWDKSLHFMPGFVLATVFAHAHLAALGWATMMVVGVSYRLLPMMFPSKMPGGCSLYASAILLEIGVLGLFAALLGRSAWAPVFGATIVAALAAFGAHVGWMLRHPVSKPAGARRPDFAVLHAAAAALSLAAAAAIGLTIATRPASPATLRAASAYGVLGLVGFLGQMVAAMEARLLPMVTWFWMYARSAYQTPPPSPHEMRNRTLQAVVFAGWTIAVPALAAGMALESPALVAAGAWSLFAAVAVSALDHGVVVARSFRIDASTSRDAA
jgi:hypothetical protein